jgi:hypothetical protein
MNKPTPFKHWSILTLIAGFILWIICFRGFILGKLSLTSDAIAYYEHIKFFVDALGRGVYPLWEPFRSQGVAFEFFLRRIGSFNPIYAILLILSKTGIPFIHAYLAWLAIYFAVGIMGFYLLARRLFQNSLFALLACLLLLFSSIGTRLFDSYILLTFIPMIWFFYFLIAFAQTPQKHNLLGTTFCWMILATTYIPFYFLIIFLTFLLCFMIIYFRFLKTIFQNSINFIIQQRKLSILCVILFTVSLLPGILFYQESKQGEVVLPERHYSPKHPEILHPRHEDVTNMLLVDFTTVASWGIEEDIQYAAVFDDLRKFKFAILYLPVWAILIFLLGFAAPINKRLIFLLLWATILYLINTPHSPIYLYLYDHVFFFKYFRNLHFFLWIILLPIAVLFITEQFRILSCADFRTPKSKFAAHAYNTLIHGLALGYIHTTGIPLWTTILTVFLSFFFFASQISFYKANNNILALMLLGLVCLQPLEVYTYLSKNSGPAIPPFLYDRPYLFLDLPNQHEKQEILKRQVIYQQEGDQAQIPYVETPSFYYGTSWFSYLRENINYRVLADEYFRRKILLYDTIEFISDHQINFKKVENMLLRNVNTALVSAEPFDWPKPKTTPGPFAEIIDRDSNLVKILQFEINQIKLKTNLPSPKFLVYNDCYHSKWEAYVNGKKTPVYRSNIAYKGVWIPGGENIVVLRFGSMLQYSFNIGMLVIFYLTFGYCVYLVFQDRRKTSFT